MKPLLLLCFLGIATPAWSAPKKAGPVSTLLQAPVAWPTIDGLDEPGYNLRVAAVQFLLRARGFYRGEIDGEIHAKTIRAVKAFQKSKRLRADGILSPRTLSALVIKVKRGSRGDAVRAAQTLAGRMYAHYPETRDHELEVDGIFGAETQTWVRIAQSSENRLQKKLVADGVMGARSWCLMLGGNVAGGH